MNVSEGLRRASAFHARGDLAGARAEAEKLLAAHPGNIVVLQFLGVVYCQAGNPARGAELLRRALQIDPTSQGIRLNLGRALYDVGDFDAATAVCEGSAASGSPEILRMRADILKAAGRLQEAIACYEVLVGLQVDDFGLWNNLGNARHEAGDTEGALDALKRARAIDPASPVAHLNLGRVLTSLDRHEDVVAELTEAARLAPRDPQILLDLAKALNRVGRSADALLPIAEAARADRANAEIFTVMGDIFSNIPDLAKAEQAYRFALATDAVFAPAYLNLGILLEQANRVDELRQLIDGMVAKGGQAAELDYLRALVLRRENRLEEALSLVRTVETSALDIATRASFVGQVADRLGDVDTAFSAFQEMNIFSASTPPGKYFSGTQASEELSQLARIVQPDWFRKWPAIALEQTKPSPAFLVGFLRSGTTLLDTVLMGHSGTHVLEEEPLLAKVRTALGDETRLADVGAEEAGTLRARYFEEMERVSTPAPGKLVIDKNPLASLRAPLIHKIFPDARFVFAVRHPCDVVLSCYMQNFKINKAMASFTDLRNAAVYYDAVMSYWHQCQSIFPLRVHTVRYEAMVEDLEQEMRPLLSFLDLAWEDSIMDHQRTAADRGYIRTPSYAQVTEKVYSRARGRWERYRTYMEPALPILAPWVERFGYEPLD